jgi:hypothetical protein
VAVKPRPPITGDAQPCIQLACPRRLQFLVFVSTNCGSILVGLQMRCEGGEATDKVTAITFVNDFLISTPCHWNSKKSVGNGASFFKK